MHTALLLLGCTSLSELPAVGPEATFFPADRLSEAGPLAMPEESNAGQAVLVEALLRHGPVVIGPNATHPRLWVALEWVADRGFCADLATRPPPAQDPERAAHELAVATCHLDPALDRSALAELPVPETGLARVQDARARIEHGLPPTPEMLAPLSMLHTDAGRNGIGTPGDAYAWGGRLADLVAWTDRPELAPALLAATSSDIDNGLYASRLVKALEHQSDPALQARHRAVCPDCTALADPLSDPDGAVLDPEIDLLVLLDAFPRHRGVLLDALERRARRELPASSRALKAIAAVDWERARSIASGAPESATTTALLRFDDPGALSSHLIALGVQDPDPDATLVAFRSSPATAQTQLFARGRVLPVQGETTLREAAARAGLGLEVRVRSPYEEGLLTVQLWSGTTRYQRLIEPWQLDEPRTVVGLLNGAAAATGHDVRFGVVQASSELVWGPPDALRKLHTEGLLHLEAFAPEPSASLEDDGNGD